MPAFIFKSGTFDVFSTSFVGKMGRSLLWFYINCKTSHRRHRRLKIEKPLPRKKLDSGWPIFLTTTKSLSWLWGGTDRAFLKILFIEYLQHIYFAANCKYFFQTPSSLRSSAVSLSRIFCLRSSSDSCLVLIMKVSARLPSRTKTGRSFSIFRIASKRSSFVMSYKPDAPEMEMLISSFFGVSS